MKTSISKKKMTVFIVGDIPINITLTCRRNFFLAETLLLKKGFSVINPVTVIENRNQDRYLANRINIRKLTTCDAILILDETNISSSNAELKIAFMLNMIVLHGIFSLTDEKPSPINENSSLPVFDPVLDYCII